jgi:hypothetical protein
MAGHMRVEVVELTAQLLQVRVFGELLEDPGREALAYLIV